jgi:hypothetical protein
MDEYQCSRRCGGVKVIRVRQDSQPIPIRQAVITNRFLEGHRASTLAAGRRWSIDFTEQAVLRFAMRHREACGMGSLRPIRGQVNADVRSGCLLWLLKLGTLIIRSCSRPNGVHLGNEPQQQNELENEESGQPGHG